jgi:hypothetical protein
MCKCDECDGGGVCQEQTTPVAVAFSDIVAKVTHTDFPDYDLDFGDIGGTLSWRPPADTSQVTYYDVYLAVASIWHDGVNPCVNATNATEEEFVNATNSTRWKMCPPCVTLPSTQHFGFVNIGNFTLGVNAMVDWLTNGFNRSSNGTRAAGAAQSMDSSYAYGDGNAVHAVFNASTAAFTQPSAPFEAGSIDDVLSDVDEVSRYAVWVLESEECPPCPLPPCKDTPDGIIFIENGINQSNGSILVPGIDCVLVNVSFNASFSGMDVDASFNATEFDSIVDATAAFRATHDLPPCLMDANGSNSANSGNQAIAINGMPGVDCVISNLLIIDAPNISETNVSNLSETGASNLSGTDESTRRLLSDDDMIGDSADDTGNESNRTNLTTVPRNLPPDTCCCSAPTPAPAPIRRQLRNPR